MGALKYWIVGIVIMWLFLMMVVVCRAPDIAGVLNTLFVPPRVERIKETVTITKTYTIHDTVYVSDSLESAIDAALSFDDITTCKQYSNGDSVLNSTHVLDIMHLFNMWGASMQEAYEADSVYLDSVYRCLDVPDDFLYFNRPCVPIKLSSTIAPGFDFASGTWDTLVLLDDESINIEPYYLDRY